MVNFEKTYEERKARVETAVANRIPDRVPNVLRVGSYPLAKAGLSAARAMVDHEAACQAMLDFYTHYTYTDTGSVADFTPPAKMLEALDLKTARWPGDPKGLDDNNTYQFIEFPTLLEDEYEELFNDPAGFWLRRRLPRTIGALEFLEDTDFLRLAAHSPQNYMTDPRLIPVYRRLLDAAEENARYQRIVAEYSKRLTALGYYSISGGGSATAFDVLGDGLRGTMGLMTDLILERDKVKKAIELFCDLHIRTSLDFCKRTGSHYHWVMLHKGFDNFISDKDYAELYWPYLQRWIVALVDNGIVPVVYTEGSYTTRLKYLKDVPVNKVIYHFEEVDLKLAKKELGDIACLMGGFPVYTVKYGKPAEIREAVKRHLDIMAPGGGYLFATGYSLGDCPQENLETLLESVEAFGKY